MEVWFPWSMLGEVSFEEVREARIQSHNAVQWLARYSRSYLPKKADDSHTSLTWNPYEGSLNTQAIEIRNHRIIFSFDFFTLAIQVKSDLGSILFDLGITGLTNSQVEEKFKEILIKIGLPLNKFKTDLPYCLSPWEMGHEDRYHLGWFIRGASELGRYFTNSQSIFQAIAKMRGQNYQTLCWPHHFDLANLIIVEENSNPEKTKSIGLGFSPGDNSYEDPYFYVTPWPYPEKENLPILPEPAFWHTEGFIAGIIKSKVMVGPDVETRVFSSLSETVSACERVLLK